MEDSRFSNNARKSKIIREFMNSLLKEFLSIKFAAIMMIVFGISCAVATIVESKIGTDAAWAYIYNTVWFGAIMVILGLNLIYNLYKYKMADMKKLPSFIFHFSFVFILLGAILTRYFGFEGMVHIREGASSDVISTRPVYIQLMAHDEDGKIISNDLNQYISTKGKNSFDLGLKVKGKEATLTYKEFILNGAEDWAEGEGGSPRAEFLFSDDRNRRSISLMSGQSEQIGPISFTFNAPPVQVKFINIKTKDGVFYINTNQEVAYMMMSDGSKGVLEKNKDILIDKFTIYSIENGLLNFAPSSLLNSAVKTIKPLPEKSQGFNAIKADLSYNGDKKEVYMLFGEDPKKFAVGGETFFVAWAPKLIKMPFALELKDFKLDRYPGSNSPSGYSSEVIVKDGDNSFDYEIYMNHVLDHAGYRFFQSSYDMDEKGTILSVNKDPGKFPTYVGYFLLSLGMFLNFFNKNSRFLKLSRLIDESSRRDDTKKTSGKASKKTAALLMIAFLCVFGNSRLEAVEIPRIDPNHADKLSNLIVQGFDGRMEPFDTMSRELLNKIYRSENYHELNHNAVMLSIMVNPEYWRNFAPIIKVSENELKDIIGIPHSQTHAKFDDFYALDENNKTYYKLQKYAEEINRKHPGSRSILDKEILKVDERLNIFFMIYTGEIIKIVPKENSDNNEWFSPINAMMYFDKDERLRASKVLQDYFANVVEAQQNGEWAGADRGLENLKAYQVKYGNSVIPGESEVKFELFFNKAKIFERLTPIYLLSGFALLVFVFIRMMRPNVKIGFAFKSVYLVNFIAFIVHTIGLGIRWYISGHAPWSNAYESLVYIAWALSLSGIIFSKTSALSLALTSILAGITLFVAHLSGMDPQITNIQPVLKSYWLTIHVSVITASYGFLGLSWLLGIFALILFTFCKKESHEIKRSITEATRINEMSMILGLCLLTVGNFLGGVWANESWGRYWGWDSKETWSLITILVYAAITHFRFIAKLNNQYAFAVASALAYASVIMTYFGVNFYLTGMHSYASGDRIPVPTSVWVISISIIVLCVLAFFKRSNAQKL